MLRKRIVVASPARVNMGLRGTNGFGRKGYGPPGDRTQDHLIKSQVLYH